MTTTSAPPTPPDPSDPRPLVRTDADLLGVWTTLMSPLGFPAPALWLMVVAADGRPWPTLVEVERRPEPPGLDHDARLGPFLRQVVRDGGGGRVAALLVRPGRGTATLDDRDWAAAIYRAGRLGGVGLLSVHLATADRLCVLPVDDVLDRLGA